MRPPYDKDGSGDWFTNEDGDHVVRTVGIDPIAHKEALLVALHELVESVLCFHAGISQEAVDAFDAAYDGDGEPGDDPRAPYRRQHRQACLVEFLVADMLGMPGYGRME